ncbi:MAG: hypothetical protein K9I69_08270 [Ignavibacteriales bacterium]|nr:hypothetical protein [Ignavibacteriales bacterium]MCF8306658.1 hypothetical protein [Ignavibacteriales bacterium]MCF8316242.1 hypothetical protein [Ignavibacteriales bacterium]MCF8437826.1 hypothetical protein [Ignavibacteriales bacterium]
MKKVFRLSFILIYFFATAGITITTHFCGSEISSVSLFRSAGEDGKCGCPENSCCSCCCIDDIKLIKVNDSFIGEVKFEQKLFSSESVIITENLPDLMVSDKCHFFPPEPDFSLYSPDIITLNCTYLI